MSKHEDLSFEDMEKKLLEDLFMILQGKEDNIKYTPSDRKVFCKGVDGNLYWTYSQDSPSYDTSKIYKLNGYDMVDELETNTKFARFATGHDI